MLRGNVMMKLKVVDLIACGYEWECPKCKKYQRVIAIPGTDMEFGVQTLVCKSCQEKFELGAVNDAYE